MSNVGDILTTVRVHIREASESDFSNSDTLIPLVNRSHIWMAAELGRIPTAGYFEAQEDETLAASDTDIPLSDLTSGGTGTSAVAIKDIYYQYPGGNWVPCEEITLGNEWKYTAISGQTQAHSPPRYLLRRPNIIFRPVSSTARTLRITFRFQPKELTVTGSVLTTPEVYDDLVALRVATWALADEGTVNPKLEQLLQQRLDDMLYYEQRPTREGRPHPTHDATSEYFFG